MAVKVYITIDTEEDAWGEFKATNNSVDNISSLPMLQDIFDRYGAIPTYLVNWPVVQNNNARRILSDFLNKGRCEIGTHCHPWNTPPFEEQLNEKNSMLSNLPYDLILRKIETIHEAIYTKFRITPVSFRAGRWAFNSKVAQSIIDFGYRIDTSVTPFVDWTEYGGPEFFDASTSAYKLDPNKVVCEQADGSLLEVPPTIGFYQRRFKLCSSIRNIILKGPLSHYRLISLLDRLGLLNFRWLSPEVSSGSDMVRLSKTFLKLGHRHLNMPFHSSSLLPGKSPFVKTEQQLKLFLNKIELFLRFAVDHGLEFSTLSDALKEHSNWKG